MSQNQDPIHLARQFEIIFTTHYSAVKYFAINLLKSEEDAEDIIQDVFAKLWTQPEVWLENKDIGQYIYDMTKNTTFNFIKRKRLEQSYQEQLSQKYLIEDLLKSEDTLDPIYYKEALLIIRLILDRLPERRRKVFEMSRINNLRNDLKAGSEIRKFIESYSKNKNSKLYQALADAVMRANWEKLKAGSRAGTPAELKAGLNSL